ncbi:hypothetical protein [Streptomyces anulatus]|uniref:hypothetical protein n=1 Tax=Streptomyces anulatus TaxID=1892 RepID=UPI002257DE7E|nr:hypothetical protein [Streptomyces anulatus]MCX4502742.1 hypothetical protein [Streptomyces anulatus]
MKYSTPTGGTTEVRARVFGKSTVLCTCGFHRTVSNREADHLANSHAGSCRRGVPASSRRPGPGSIGNQRR